MPAPPGPVRCTIAHAVAGPTQTERDKTRNKSSASVFRSRTHTRQLLADAKKVHRPLLPRVSV